jgi:hypothetical protein
MIIDPNTVESLKEIPSKITPSVLRNLPIPKAAELKKFSLKRHKSGSLLNIIKKLHCVHCGKKREVKLATTALHPDGSVAMIYIRVKKLLSTLNVRKHINLPPYFVGECFICHGNTYYRLNNNNKFEIETDYEVDNARTDNVGGEIPPNENN